MLKETFTQLKVESPFTFQLDVGNALLAGQNVLLVAPTGSGKTVTALAPFVHARLAGVPFADRLIYALPLRTLAATLYESAKEKIEPLGLKVTIQMGNRPEDPYFAEGDVIFTTIDQVLSAYIGLPVSLRPGLANLPAGALVGAYLVFDEFHLLETVRSLGTLMDLAERFQSYARLLLMSATVPERVVPELSRRARAVVRLVSPGEAAQLPSQAKKIRRFAWVNSPLTADAVLRNRGRRTLVVCNTVERAQKLFEELKNAMGASPPIILLHSRFLPEDRAAKERFLVERFGKDGQGEGIVVATQVVEVGLDISFDVLHTEVAPANSLIQRVGRCARFEGESGTVYVYPLEQNASGQPRYGPYRDRREEVDDTVEALTQWEHDQPMMFHDELLLLDRVHGDRGLRSLKELNPHRRRSDVNTAILQGNGADVRELVRDVDAINVLVHSSPERLDLRKQPQQFSVPATVVYRFARSLDLKGADAGAIRVARFSDDEGYGGGPQWDPVQDWEELRAAFLIAVSPRYAAYDRYVGLRFGKDEPFLPGNFTSVETGEAAATVSGPARYERETYAEHVRRVRLAYSGQRDRHAQGMARLATRLGVTPETLEHLCEAAVSLHDVGKLSSRWQDAIWNWQADMHNGVRDDFLAHSDFDGNLAEHQERIRDPRYRRPPHAAEGAFAASQILGELALEAGISDALLYEVVSALASAIARHHAARTSELGCFELAPGAEAAVAATLGLPEERVTLLQRPTQAERVSFAGSLASPSQELAFPLYLFLARRLRLADWQSFSVEGNADGAQPVQAG